MGATTYEDLIKQLVDQGAWPPPKQPVKKPVNPIAAAADHVLIMELLSRGYAVAKMSAEDLAEANK